MAKGDTAKKEVIEKLKKAFGEDYIGEESKKHYVWANDGSERVQIAVSLTCPKTFIDAPKTATKPVDVVEDFDWGDTSASAPAPTQTDPLIVSKEEEDNIRLMMERLGL